MHFLRRPRYLSLGRPRRIHLSTLPPVLRAIGLSVILLLAAVWYCATTFTTNPFSIFFRRETAYELRYSALRQQQADTWRRKIEAGITGSTAADEDDGGGGGGHPGGKAGRAGSHPEICLAITTVPREGEKQYFDDLVASLLDGLYEDERALIFTIAIFAQTQPALHPSWTKPWLHATFDEVASYDVSDEDFLHLTEWEEHHDYHAKGVFDYVYALRRCLARDTPYILILEDDVLMTTDWLTTTLHGISRLSALMAARSNDGGGGGEPLDWTYLRLFYSDPAFDWGERVWWFREKAFAVLLAMNVVGGALLLLQRRGHAPSSSLLPLTPGSIAVLALLTTPTLVTLALLVGPNSLQPPPDHGAVLAMDQGGCCSQALLYPSREAGELASYLARRARGQTDVLIESYATETLRSRWALGRPVAQHVGTVSSRGNVVENTRSYWSCAFEAFESGKRERWHESGWREWVRRREGM